MAINPVQAVTLEALKGLTIGTGSREAQILEARVTAMLSKTLARLDIAGQTIDVMTPRPLTVGSVLTLRAEQSGGQLKLIVQGQLPGAPEQPVASPQIRSAGAGIAEPVRAALARIQPVPVQTTPPGGPTPAPQPQSSQTAQTGQAGAAARPLLPEAAIQPGQPARVSAAPPSPPQILPAPLQVRVRTVSQPAMPHTQSGQLMPQQTATGQPALAASPVPAAPQATAAAVAAQPRSAPASATPAVPAQPGSAPAALPAAPAVPPQIRPTADASSSGRPQSLEAEQSLPFTPAPRGAVHAPAPGSTHPLAGQLRPARASSPPPGASIPLSQRPDVASSQVAATAELAGRGHADGVADPAATPRAERLATMVFDLPIHLAGNEAPLRLQVTREDEPQEEGDGAARSQSWTVRFASEAGRLGMVHAMISMIEGHIGVQLWAERQDTADLFKQGAAQLREALEASALKLDGINIAQGSPLGPE